MPLKRLFSRSAVELPLGDLATDDWAPVPVNATAQRQDTMDWLLEDDGQVMPPDLPLAFTPVEAELDLGEPSYLQCFSPEELAVIAEQQNTWESVSEPTPPAPEPRPQPVQTRDRSRWIDLLRACGEYLSEAELKVIRQQLAS